MFIVACILFLSTYDCHLFGLERAVTIREAPVSIDYLDAGHGLKQAGLGEVSLHNAAGA